MTIWSPVGLSGTGILLPQSQVIGSTAARYPGRRLTKHAARTFPTAHVSGWTAMVKAAGSAGGLEIPILILLLSPGPRHESDLLVRDVCTTRADGGKSERPYFDHPFRPRTREEFYQHRDAVLERKGALAARSANLRGLPHEGVVPSDLLAPPQVAGRTPARHTSEVMAMKPSKRDRSGYQ